MLVHVLIQKVLTFKILKTYMGFCIFWPMKDYAFWLCRLDLPTKSQFSKITLLIKVIFSLRSKPNCSAHNKLNYAFPDKLRENLLLS